jgi:hypothetical protein
MEAIGILIASLWALVSRVGGVGASLALACGSLPCLSSTQLAVRTLPEALSCLLVDCIVNGLYSHACI